MGQDLQNDSWQQLPKTQESFELEEVSEESLLSVSDEKEGEDFEEEEFFLEDDLLEFEKPPLSIHGFVSQGFQKSSRNNLYIQTEKGTTALGEVGLTFHQELTERLDLGIQLLALKFGDLSDFRLKVDWAFGDYVYCDALGFRFGKVKSPLGFWNEVRDVEAAKPFIILPQGLYNEMLRPYFTAVLGGGIYGQFDLNCWGKLKYEAYYGATDFSEEDSVIRELTSSIFLGLSANPISISEISKGYSIVFLDWYPPIENARLAFSHARVRADIFVTFRNAVFPVLGKGEFSGIVYDLKALSAQYRCKNWTFIGEVGYFDIDGRFSFVSGGLLPSVSGSLKTQSLDYYFAVEYRVCDQVTLASYYDTYYSNLSKKSDPRSFLKDLALSLRLDINPYWVLKFEGHHFSGTGTLLQSLDFSASSMPATDWWLGAVKATFVF